MVSKWQSGFEPQVFLLSVCRLSILMDIRSEICKWNHSSQQVYFLVLALLSEKSLKSHLTFLSLSLLLSGLCQTPLGAPKFCQARNSCCRILIAGFQFPFEWPDCVSRFLFKDLVHITRTSAVPQDLTGLSDHSWCSVY